MAFPNAISGSYGYEKVESSSQKHALGTKMVFVDGREYSYAENGGSAIAEGLLVAAEAPEAQHDEDLAVATAAAGSSSITVTLGSTAAAKDLYKDGYLFLNKPTATSTVHEFYKIKSHPQAAAAATLELTLYDNDKLHTAITNGTDTAGLLKSPYKDIVVAPAAVAGRLVGLTVNNFTASYYGWVQTAGLAVGKIDGTPAFGTLVGASSNHAGQMLAVGADTTPAIARVHGVAATTNDEFHTVWLQNLN